MKPFRRKHKIETTAGQIPGQERILESRREDDVLSDEGSVDTMDVHKRYSSDCGCFQPPAGRCEFCKSLSCIACHGHCESCNAPICRECSVFVSSHGGQAARFCQRCHAVITRRARTASVVRFFLSPFARFGGKDDE